MTAILTIVLAAGEGTRMKSKTPKVLHKVGGLPMLGHVVSSCRKAGADEIAVVLGPKHQESKSYLEKLDSNIKTVTQHEQLGTGHAAMQARDHWQKMDGYVFVLFADNPMIHPQTIERAKAVLDDGADLVVVGYEPKSPFGLGRLVMDGDQLVKIVEEKDASDDERQIGFCNSGIMGFKTDCLNAIIDKIENKNAQGEYYLTDAAQIARENGFSVKRQLAQKPRCWV